MEGSLYRGLMPEYEDEESVPAATEVSREFVLDSVKHDTRNKWKLQEVPSHDLREAVGAFYLDKGICFGHAPSRVEVTFRIYFDGTME